MKKLFTTLLLLGAVGYAQAQVTVTDFDATKKTVTINYDRSAGKATEADVAKAIKDAFEGDEAQGIAPTMVDSKMDKKARASAVSTVILTGDWDNEDTDKANGKTIKKAVDEFSDKLDNQYVTLDLSACTKFCSEFISVRDVCNNQDMGATTVCPGYQDDKFDTYFTVNNKLPDEVTTMTLTKETTVGEIFVENNNADNKLDENGFDNDGAYNAFINELINGTHTGSYGFTYKKGNQEWHGNIKYYEAGASFNPWNTANQSGWYFVSDDTYNQKQLVINYNNSYFCDGNEVKVDNENALVDNGNGTYSYTITITHKDTPFALVSGEYDNLIDGIIFPTGAKFTYIPDNLCKDNTNLKKVVLSSNIVAIGNKAFGGATNLTEVNFPASLNEIGYAAFKNTGITAANLAPCTGITRMRFETFQQTPSLTTITFPQNIIEIQKEFCLQSGITSVDLSNCHKLRVISQFAFNNCQSLTDVKICSHPKVIRGPEGKGAFCTSQHIQRVEITACSHIDGIDDVTDVTRCWCEAGAFDPLITRVQTQFENASQGAHLIFPRTAPVLNSGNFENPYASAFDFFVGDYKAGAPINQSNLQVFYKDVPVPNEGYSVEGFGKPVGQPSLPELVGDARYNNNGWLEFINIDELEIIVPNDNLFLRTYSRTAGTGPVLLPVGDDAIHAFRVLDYRNTTKESDFDGEVVKDEDGNLLTLHGYIVLKELTVKDKNGVIRGYVPENTGVVYYSKKIDEVAGLILKEATTADLAAGESFTEYPNTGTDFDQTDPATTTSMVNMLVPSKGDPIGVTPTSPWNDKKNCYENPRTHRNFSLDATAKKWKRVKVGTLRANRAYVHLPISRFNNEDEPDAMNDFNEEDNGLTNLTAVGMIFEGDEATEIITIDAKGNITQDEGWYTLQGVKVTRPTKGVYIHNNKKVVFK